MLSALAHWLHIIFLWPVVLWFIRYGFEPLYVARSLVRFQSIIVNVIITWFLIRLSFWQMFKNVFPAFFASGVMMLVAYGMLLFNKSLIWQGCAILACILVYFCVIWFFPTERNLVFSHLSVLKSKHIKHN